MSQQSKNAIFATLRPVNSYAKRAMSNVVEYIESLMRSKDDNASANSSSSCIVYHGENYFKLTDVSVSENAANFDGRKHV